ncbi:symporter, partial [Marivirga lumbricoides]
MNVDEITLNFNAEGLLLLNFLLAFIMFGVALELQLKDFKRVFSNPKATLVGLIAQWVLLPVITIFLIYIFNPQSSIALGMVLVAVCPGGNISNFVSKLAGADTALSVSLTALTTSAAIFITPLSFAFWSGFIPSSPLEVGSSITMDVADMFFTIFNLIILPVAVGLLFGEYFPSIAQKIKKP